MDGEKRVVVLTGAGHGLGHSIALALHRTERFRLVLTARGASLDQGRSDPRLRGSAVTWRALDVTIPEEREALVDGVATEFGRIDVLINNAGVMMRAVLEHLTESDHLRQFAVNYRAPLELARLVLPGMRERRSGHIINISSVGGMMAMPTMSVYSASKFALEGASEALYYEVRPWNVHVSLVQPGFINSDGFEHIAFSSRSRGALESANSPYRRHYEQMGEFIAKLMRLAPSTPESVAARIVSLLERKRPPLRVAGTLDAALFNLLRRWLPRGLYHEVLYRSLPGIATWGPRNE